MSALARIMPTPRLLERDVVTLAAPLSRAWEIVRHDNLARSRLVRALFTLRTLPHRLLGHRPQPLRLRVDDFESTRENPGFQLLADDPPRELVIGAIGKVWQLDIPFAHVGGAQAFTEFSEPGFIKVAWAIQLAPLGNGTHLIFELRVDSTDGAAWRRFTRYFRLIGPASRFIRRSLLAGLARDLRGPSASCKLSSSVIRPGGGRASGSR